MAENFCSNQETSQTKRNYDLINTPDDISLGSTKETLSNVADIKSKRMKTEDEDQSGQSSQTSSTVNQPRVDGGDNSTEENPFTMNSETGHVAEEGRDEDSLSEMSGMSDISIDDLNAEAKWRNVTGPVGWVQRQMMLGVNPRTVLEHLIPGDVTIPAHIDDVSLWKAVIEMLTEPPQREKLTDVNLLEDVINLILKSSKIMVLTGAGVSVSCGIPDFRSRDGIYSRLAVEYPDLPDPQAMFDIRYFKNNQKPFFKFAKEIYPGQFQPSISHKFISLLEKQGKLLRNFTQNIDTLEQVAGITKVVQCHGSFATASCMNCKHKVDHKAVEEDIMNQVIPRCPICPDDAELPVMKPDIVFFGESLPEEFHRQMDEDKDVCDLLIVMGSSLKVRPVALIPNSLPPTVPQILINREPLKHLTFDVELLGDCDYIVQELCLRLGEKWTEICKRTEPAKQIMREDMPPVDNRAGISGKRAPQGEDSSGNVSNDCAETSGEAPNSGSTDHDGDGVDSGQSLDPTETNGKPERSRNISQSQDSDSSNRQIDNSNSLETESQPKSNVHHVSSPNLVCDSKKVSDETSAKEVSVQIAKETNQETQHGSCLDISSTTASNLKPNFSTCSDTVPKNDNNEQKTVKDTNVSENAASSESERNNESEQPSNSNIVTDANKTEECSGENSADINIKEKEDDPGSTEAETSAEERELEKMRSMWRPRFVNLAAQLPEGTFLYIPENRYIFNGAEFLQDLDDVSDGESSSDDSDADEENLASSKLEDQSNEIEAGGFEPDFNAIQAAMDKNAHESNLGDIGKLSAQSGGETSAATNDAHNFPECNTNEDSTAGQDERG